MNVRAMPDGIGHAAGLEQDVFGPLGTSHDLRHRSDQIVADVAADAAIGEIDDVPVVFDSDDEFGVDVDRAEVVHQHGNPKTVIARQNAIQQRRLAGAEESGEDGQRHRVRGRLIIAPPLHLRLECVLLALRWRR